MGLLASGAAHELGTPLATVSVILNDWERMPAMKADPDLDAEIGEMQAALDRCKDIVSRILLAAGEARSEKAERTRLVDFLDDTVADWEDSRGPSHLDYENTVTNDTVIVSDTMIRQLLFNVFDNALEGVPRLGRHRLWRSGTTCSWVTVRDKGTRVYRRDSGQFRQALSIDQATLRQRAWVVPGGQRAAQAWRLGRAPQSSGGRRVGRAAPSHQCRSSRRRRVR